jgi:hypothetical protein
VRGRRTDLCLMPRRNSVTFAVATNWVDSAENQEVRSPQLVSLRKMSDALYLFDLGPVRPITDWRSLYEWLGADKEHAPWAAFRPDDAARLVPHWLGKSVRYTCYRLEHPWIEFSELAAKEEIVSETARFNFLGQSPENGANMWFLHLRDNLVASKRPLFPQNA